MRPNSLPENRLRRAINLIHELKSQGMEFRARDGQPILILNGNQVTDHDRKRLRQMRESIMEVLPMDWEGDYPVPMPENGRWVTYSDLETGEKTCESESLSKRPWVMWRYSTESRWYARTGYSWDEGDDDDGGLGDEMSRFGEDVG